MSRREGLASNTLPCTVAAMLSRSVPSMLHASAPVPQDKFCGFLGKLDLQAAGLGQDGKPALRAFDMELYNGGPMRFWWSDVPVVVDLQGMDLGQGASPVFKDHNPALIVGHTTSKRIVEGSLLVSGVVSGVGAVAREVVAAADNGFPWQASQGTAILEVEELAAGESRTVNGREFQGPGLVVTKSKLGEASFVPLGADDTTVARMVAAARAPQPPAPQTKEHPVKFSTWLKAQGFTPETLTAAQITTLQAAFKAAHADGEVDAIQASAPEAPQAPDDLQAARAAAAAETRRIADIRSLCAGQHAEVEAKAIEEGWSKDRTELEVLRASRTAPAGIVRRDTNLTGDVLKAAALQSAGLMTKDEVSKTDSRVLEAADRRFKGRMSLQEMLLEAAWANGYSGRSFRSDMPGVLRAAFGLQAGFSAIDIAGILANTANKSLLAGFMGVEGVWRDISAIGSVTDFKEVTRYRLTGANQYEKVAPTGEIKSGSMGEASYGNKADTYGLLLSLTRTDLINDDLGALGATPRMLGRGAALKINDVFWTEFLDNASFFAAGNANYFEGAATTLSIDSLTTAEQKFLDQTDHDGKPLAISPRLLLVPTALSAKAAQLMSSLELRDTTASTKYGVANPHAGKFRTVVSTYLANASYSGASSTAWYMLADPQDMATIETVFLNGVQNPTVESADADFATLGIQMRGYHDFGVRKQEPRAGVKSKGAA